MNYAALYPKVGNGLASSFQLNSLPLLLVMPGVRAWFLFVLGKKKRNSDVRIIIIRMLRTLTEYVISILQVCLFNPRDNPMKWVHSVDRKMESQTCWILCPRSYDCLPWEPCYAVVLTERIQQNTLIV